ncbi:MAG TPA: aminotransferase class III-fold pyridoxal phosphate-dependent enzyme [Candidatus Eisenbacteria bacterium]|nr:aminotransferase class III-fold pyridoxal phosphate-dependent enzyme [Candidatus Eisenbacteria bacterium]
MSRADESPALHDRTQLGPDHPVAVRAEGCWLWDRDGRRYLDATSGAFCVNLGYTRPDLVEAMTRAAELLPHARPSLFDNEEAEAYRAELLAAAGPPFTRVLLTSSGSEAVEAALKIALAYQRAVGEPSRTKIRSLAGHYHGATLGALAVTGWDERRRPWETRLGARLEGLPQEGDRCAAFIAETIPVAGLGVEIPSPGESALRRAACDRDGALWIADEVLTGFGRAGSLFAWERVAESSDADGGAVPDLVTFGKGAGAGFAPLAGVLVAGRVAEAIESSADARFSHQQTYGGHPIACAVGRAVLRAMSDEGWPARVRAMEASLRPALLAGVAVLGGRVKAFGAMAAAAWEPRGAGPPGHEAAQFVTLCRERGIVLHAATAVADAVCVVATPPFTFGEEEFLELTRRVSEAAATTSRGT